MKKKEARNENKEQNCIILFLWFIGFANDFIEPAGSVGSAFYSPDKLSRQFIDILHMMKLCFSAIYRFNARNFVAKYHECKTQQTIIKDTLRENHPTSRRIVGADYPLQRISMIQSVLAAAFAPKTNTLIRVMHLLAIAFVYKIKSMAFYFQRRSVANATLLRK